MLNPDDRAQLLDALRPPEGFKLDRAVATTYSLDLLSLLTAPLAFTFFDSEDADGEPTQDPVALLHAIRSHAEHIHVFCQQGRIAVPARYELLFQQLEGAVMEVRPPSRKGVFHPKLWVLRFARAGEPARYRVLVSSRNLTFDRSWDVQLTLEGQVQGREVRGSAPLAEFVAALPHLSVRTVEGGLRRVLQDVASELARVSVEKPPGCDRMRFHPIGHNGSAVWPFPERADRILVISPFVSSGCLARFRRMSKRVSLIGRAEELAALSPSALKGVAPVWSWRTELNMLEAGEPDERPEDAPPPAGLHAKLVSLEQGGDASLFVGSANATTAAFEQNVEFVVELTGPRREFGAEALLGDSRSGLSPLLEEFTPGERDVPTEDQRKAEERLQGLCEFIGRLGLGVHVEPRDEMYDMVLRCESRKLDGTGLGAEVSCHPASLGELGSAQEFHFDSVEPVRFDGCSPSALTSFFAFHVSVRQGRAVARRSFVLNLPMHGEPAGRGAAVLQQILQDRQQLLALLVMMLSAEGLPADGLAERLKSGQGFAGALGLGGHVTLFEALLRALDRDPERLDRLKSTIDELRSSTAARDLLPEGFDTVWEPIWVAREGLK